MIIGIGTDIIDIIRFRKSIDNQRFLEKVFTDKERDLCRRKQSELQSLAARFAAKEACMKALGTGWSEGISFHDIEILNNEDGIPVLRFYGKTLRKTEELGVKSSFVSISHIKDMASALVILEK